MSDVFVIIKMCYVHNQWYDISCATLYILLRSVNLKGGERVHRVLVGKPEGKGPLGRPRRRWEDNIKMDLQEVDGGWEDWMELAQDRDRWRALVSTVMNLRVPKSQGIS